MALQRISPCLWFDGNAEEAVAHYTSIFPNSKVRSVTRYGALGPGEEGSVMFIVFELDGTTLQALNGGPQFKFNEAVSMSVACRTQAEIDHYWTRLGEGGEHSVCGWLKDKFGLSWQIAPARLEELIARDAAASARVMAEVMKMTKLDLATLERAAAG